MDLREGDRSPFVDDREQVKEFKQRVEELERLVDVLADGKYLWESTFDAIQDPVMIVGDDYRISRINRAGARASEMPIRDVIGEHCYEMLAGRHAPCPDCPLRNTLDRNSPHHARLKPFPKSGCSYEVNAYPLYNQYVGSTQVVLHYRDTTEEESLYRQLLQSEKMAAVGTLAGGVAHEINNPLGGILAFAQLMLRNLPKDSDLLSDLTEIEGAALRCKEIVDHLLDFSRVPVQGDASGVDVNDVVLKLIPLLNVKLAKSSIRIVTTLAECLPMACGHPNRIQQVLLNLATNALYAMRERGGLLEIKTYLEELREPNRNMVCIEVKDAGEGISKKHIDQIFDPYFTTKKQGEGTGLGLSISYGIVEDYGGTVGVESEEGVGTTVKIALPVPVLRCDGAHPG